VPEETSGQIITPDNSRQDVGGSGPSINQLADYQSSQSSVHSYDVDSEANINNEKFSLTLPVDNSTDIPIKEWLSLEYVAHKKDRSWFVYYTIFICIILLSIFALTRDILTCIVVLLCLLAFGYYANKQPKQVTYRLYDHFFSIGTKIYRYSQFKSFTIDRDVSASGIILRPLRRFAPFTAIYFPPEFEKDVVSIIEPTLPLEDRKEDLLDRLLRRVRF